MAEQTKVVVTLTEAGPFEQALRHQAKKYRDRLDADEREYLVTIADIVSEQRSVARGSVLYASEAGVSRLGDYATMLREYAGDLVVGACKTTELDPRIEAAFSTDLAKRLEFTAGIEA